MIHNLCDYWFVKGILCTMRRQHYLPRQQTESHKLNMEVKYHLLNPLIVIYIFFIVIALDNPDVYKFVNLIIEPKQLTTATTICCP